ncbi:MAG: hypothetical protein LBK60_04945 [Verrucomicrobiales bacterium]|jgi:hypothetical protein|nr:hypothetical protein [Verrucomicrobiales bacterium]
MKKIKTMKLTMKLVALGLTLLPLTLARGATYNYNLVEVLSGSTPSACAATPSWQGNSRKEIIMWNSTAHGM